jgi:RNA polymerase sigma-70 factor (ECF subfamily)
MNAINVLSIDRCSVEDSRRFDEIVQQHKNRIYHYICRMTHDSPDAEDLTQEVFIKAYQSLATFRQEAAVDTWLYRIATNLVIDRFRRRKRGPLAWLAWGGGDEEGDPLAELPDPDRGSDPADVAELTELQAEVHGAIATLPPKLRSAVILHDMEGLSYEEVAAVVGCPIGTVKSRLFNGRTLLRRKLARYVEA